MGEFWAQINGVPLTSGRFSVPRYGVPAGSFKLADDSKPFPTGAATLEIDDRSFSVTVARVTSTAGEVTLQVVGGSGGWGRDVPVKHYHSDAGVTAKRVISEVAGEVGEKIAGNSTFRSTVVGTAYSRQRGPAVRTLNDLAEFWGVREDGLTYCGARPLNALDPNVAILRHDTASRLVEVYVSRFSALDSSCRRDDLDDGFESLVFNGYRIEFDGHNVQTFLTVQDVDGATGDRFTQAFQRLANQEQSNPHLWGLYEYEVVRMVAQRIDLKIVDPVSGVPDLVAVEQWLGPATSAVLPAGVRVGVMYRNGQASKPSIVSVRSSDDITLLALGGDSPVPVATVGDLVQIQLPPAMPFTGVAGGIAVAGTITPIVSMTGTIIGPGSRKVGVKK